MGQYRLQRLNDQLRDEISTLILRGEIKDPRVNTFLSINRVEVTNDLAYAKVYVSTFLPDGQLKKGVDGLNSAAGMIVVAFCLEDSLSYKSFRYILKLIA